MYALQRCSSTLLSQAPPCMDNWMAVAIQLINFWRVQDFSICIPIGVLPSGIMEKKPDQSRTLGNDFISFVGGKKSWDCICSASRMEFSPFSPPFRSTETILTTRNICSATHVPPMQPPQERPIFSRGKSLMRCHTELVRFVGEKNYSGSRRKKKNWKT